MTETNVHPAMLMALVDHYAQAKVYLSSPHFQNYQGSKLLSASEQTMELFSPGPITLKPPPPAFRSELKPRKLVCQKAENKKKAGK